MTEVADISEQTLTHVGGLVIRLQIEGHNGSILTDQNRLGLEIDPLH